MNEPINWKRKLTSRKLWIAVSGLVSGLYLALGGESSDAEVISGVILQAASVLGYLLAEGLADSASAGAPAPATQIVEFPVENGNG